MNKSKYILWIILFNLLIIISELVFGFISNSFALVADALHNTGDVMALIVTYVALKLALKKATFSHTFAYIRAEMMAAFINTLFLLITMFYMIYEASMRFLNPETIAPLYMIIVGFIALLANGVSAYLLSKIGLTHTLMVNTIIMKMQI